MSLCLLLCCSACALSVCESRVVDSQTGSALPFATISVNGRKTTVSNSDGFFRVEVSEGDVLRISYVGYKPQILTFPEVRGTVRMPAAVRVGGGDNGRRQGCRVLLRMRLAQEGMPPPGRRLVLACVRIFVSAPARLVEKFSVSWIYGDLSLFLHNLKDMCYVSYVIPEIAPGSSAPVWLEAGFPSTKPGGDVRSAGVRALAVSPGRSDSFRVVF